MKKLVATAAIVAMGTAAIAGNLDSFEAPAEEPMVEEAPMGGSNAAWIVPLIAIIAIVAASSSDDTQPSLG